MFLMMFLLQDLEEQLRDLEAEKNDMLVAYQSVQKSQELSVTKFEVNVCELIS